MAGTVLPMTASHIACGMTCSLSLGSRNSFSPSGRVLYPMTWTPLSPLITYRKLIYNGDREGGAITGTSEWCSEKGVQDLLLPVWEGPEPESMLVPLREMVEVEDITLVTVQGWVKEVRRALTRDILSPEPLPPGGRGLRPRQRYRPRSDALWASLWCPRSCSTQNVLFCMNSPPLFPLPIPQIAWFRCPFPIRHPSDMVC